MGILAAPTQRMLKSVRVTNYQSGLVDLPCYEIAVDDRHILYSTAGGDANQYGRVATIFAKEPTTIPWLDSFGADDVLLDIGANVGMYTIYAAMMTGCRVFAVEPEALSYAELNKNIFMNGLHERVTAFCAAASDESKIGNLYLGTFAPGYSHHDFDENTWTGDKTWARGVTTRRDRRFRQGSISVTIDQLVASAAIDFPTHIKIDVDGLEPRVIAGARKTLNDARLKTVLVEIDFKIEAAQAIIETMVDMGWKYSLDQLVANRQFIMKHERVDQLRQIKKDGFNYIFYRDDAYASYFEKFLSGYEPPFGADGKMKVAPAREAG